MHLSDQPGDCRKPEPAAPTFIPRHAIKALENPIDVFRRQAGAFVADLDAGTLRHNLGSDLDLAATAGVANRVIQQIAEDECQSSAAAHHPSLRERLHL